jgi:hypothetical protein
LSIDSSLRHKRFRYRQICRASFLRGSLVAAHDVGLAAIQGVDGSMKNEGGLWSGASPFILARLRPWLSDFERHSQANVGKHKDSNAQNPAQLAILDALLYQDEQKEGDDGHNPQHDFRLLRASALADLRSARFYWSHTEAFWFKLKTAEFAAPLSSCRRPLQERR